MAELLTPTSARPGALNNPVPGQEEAQQLQEDFSEFEFDDSVQAAAPAGEDFSEFEDAPIEEAVPIGGELGGQDGLGPGNLREEDPGFVDANFTASGIYRQMEDLHIRVATGLTDKDPKLQKQTLEAKVGKDNVKVLGNNLFFRKREGEKFRKLDPDTVELISDIFGDGFKEVATLAGGIVGAKKGGPLGAGALALAGATGVDAIEPLLGVDRGEVKDTPGRPDDFIEAVKRTAKNVPDAIAVAAGEALVKYVPLGFKKLAEKYFTSSAKIAEKKAGQIIAKDADEAMTAANESADELVRLTDGQASLKQGKITFTPDQVLGKTLPEAEALTKAATTEDAMRQFFLKQGQMTDDAWQVVKKTMTNGTGKSADDLFSSVKSAAKRTKEIEGGVIGDVRKKALDSSKGSLQQMKNSFDDIEFNINRFGFRTGENGKVLAPSVKQFLEKFPDANPAVANRATLLLGNYAKQMQKRQGKLTMKEMDSFYTGFRNTIDDLWGTQSGGKVAKEMTRMKNALRDDWAEAMGRELSENAPDAMPRYKLAMERYGSIIKGEQGLRTLLSKGDMTSASFANRILSPAQGADNVKHIKNLLQSSEPQLWDDLVKHKLDMMADAASSAKSVGGLDDATKITQVDFPKLNGAIADLEKKGILDLMLPKKEQHLLKVFLNNAKKVDAKRAFEVDPTVAGGVGGVKSLIRDMVIAAADVSGLAKISAADRMVGKVIGNVGKEGVVTKLLQGEGLELMLKQAPKAKRAALKSGLTRLRDKLILQESSLLTGRAVQGQLKNEQLNQRVK